MTGKDKQSKFSRHTDICEVELEQVLAEILEVTDLEGSQETLLKERL